MNFQQIGSVHVGVFDYPLTLLLEENISTQQWD